MPRKPKRPAKIGGMSTKELTPGQVTILLEIEKASKDGARLFQLLYGGVRAGKSTAAAYGMALHSSTRKGCEYIVGAYTQRQSIAIFMPKFKAAAELLDLPYRDSRSMSNPHMEIGDNLFSIYGGSDMSRFKNVQGLTTAGLILDEIPLLDREFMAQAEARTSERGALRIYTANKVHPYHWTTKYYYDRAKAGKITASLYDFDTSDNQHIGTDYIEERKQEYDDLHRTRFIDNEFALDAPPLYDPMYDNTEGVASLTVIFGGGSVVQIINATATEYGYCINDTIECGVGEIATVPPLGRVVMVNSDRPMLARQLRIQGHSVRGYRADYEPRRLEQTQLCLGQGKLRISPELDQLTQAIQEYNTGGVYRDGIIRGLEAMGEYVSRFSRI